MLKIDSLVNCMYVRLGLLLKNPSPLFQIKNLALKLQLVSNHLNSYNLVQVNASFILPLAQCLHRLLIKLKP